MSRYKKIYNDQKHQEYKRQNRIRIAVECMVAISWLAVIVIMGMFQDYKTVTGMCMITLGIINVCYAYFVFRMKIFGWKTMTIYDSDELYKNKYRFDKRIIEEETRSINNVRTFIGVIIAVSVPVCIVLGVCRLTGIL